MGRYLAVGTIHKKEPCDLRIFFSHSETEFLVTGPDRDNLGLQKRSSREILGDLGRHAFDLVFAGQNDFPYFNPRKGISRNLSNVFWKLLCHPSLLRGFFFPYSALRTRLIGLDLLDRPVIDTRRFRMLRHCVCYFKCQLPPNPCNAFLYATAKTEDAGNVIHLDFFKRAITKLRPISLGIDPAGTQDFSTCAAEKKIDIFFAGDARNRPNRQAGIKQLERLKAEGYRVLIAQQPLPRGEFLERCAQSYIVWSPEGHGWDCFRHYESALAGSVPLMQSPTIRRYAPFKEDEQALYYYVEGDHLERRVRQALQNRQRLLEMGQAARHHVLQWHTHEALRRYVIEETLNTVAAQRTNHSI